MKYKDETGQWKDLVLPATGDTLPIGTVVEFEGDTVPSNWVKVEDISVLYDNPDGENGTITLNDNATNYKYLEIFYGNNTILSTRTLAFNDNVILLTQNYIPNTAYYHIYYEALRITDNQLVSENSKRVDFNVDGMTIYESTQMRVYRVIGYK